MNLQPPRGTRDFPPSEMIKRELVIGVIKNIFERYGFDPFESPAIEYWELLSKKGVGGEEIKDEIYYFKDKGDRELALRFDLTTPLARFVAANPQLVKPFKRYQIGRVWRYDRPQAGRYREFWQADIDIIGSSSMSCEAECLSVANDVMTELGFKEFIIRINNRKILNGILEALDIPEKKSIPVFRTLDKIDKIGKDEVFMELKKLIGKKSEKLKEFVEISNEDVLKTVKILKDELSGYTVLEEGADEIEKIYRFCKMYGFSKRIKIDLSLVRGLDYYTGPIFEVSLSGKNIGSVAGGGRYDNLIELFGGRWTPAVGISFGIERIIDVMKAEDMLDTLERKTSVLVASATDDMRPWAIKIAQKLRKNGINTETDLMERNLKSQLDYADRAKIPYVIIVGEKEVKKGKVTIKDMAKRKQAIVSIEKVIRFFGK